MTPSKLFHSTVFVVLALIGSGRSFTTRSVARPKRNGNAARPLCGVRLGKDENGEDNKNDSKSRRNAIAIMAECIGLSTAFLVTNVDTAMAKGSSQEEDDKIKIYKGYERLNYLLDNWVKETTVCGVSDNPYISEGGCERTPLKVMDYLGYRNINDPLFRADKTMRRLESLVPPDRVVDYLEAIEKWQEAAEEGNGMAYISSWGEANPGGGKDRVALFIERAKKNVVDSRDSLATVIDILNIKKPA